MPQSTLWDFLILNQSARIILFIKKTLKLLSGDLGKYYRDAQRPELKGKAV